MKKIDIITITDAILEDFFGYFFIVSSLFVEDPIHMYSNVLIGSLLIINNKTNRKK